MSAEIAKVPPDAPKRRIIRENPKPEITPTPIEAKTRLFPS